MTVTQPCRSTPLVLQEPINLQDRPVTADRAHVTVPVPSQLLLDVIAAMFQHRDLALALTQAAHQRRPNPFRAALLAGVIEHPAVLALDVTVPTDQVRAALNHLDQPAPGGAPTRIGDAP